jgi:hypothetical protein
MPSWNGAQTQEHLDLFYGNIYVKHTSKLWTSTFTRFEVSTAVKTEFMVF